MIEPAESTYQTTPDGRRHVVDSGLPGLSVEAIEGGE